MPEPGERLAHLLVLDQVEDRDFTRQGRGDQRIRDVERRTHGEAMQREVASALAEQDHAREGGSLEELEALGVIITIVGSPGFPLSLDPLERLSRHRATPRPKWLLLSVSPETEDSPERALVWISDEYREAFLRYFEEYLDVDRDTSGGNPRNRALIANMAQIRATVLRDLWQSDGEPPLTGSHWWEVWLRPDADAVDLAHEFANRAQLRSAPNHLRFDRRHVVWIEARWDQLQSLPFTAVPITEIRRPQFTDTVQDLDVGEQMEWTEDLAGRIVPAATTAPAVCLLDTGVRRTHVLLEASLAEADMHSIVGEPSGDLHGHGTLMAGLALIGSLDDALLGNHTVTLRHRLESVKFLPDKGKTPHDPLAYGVVTAEAVARPAIAHERRRVFCMPITNLADRTGEPSLWSAAIDALAAGTDVGRSDSGIELLGPPDPDAARLLIVSAGNIRDGFDLDYRRLADLSPIEDPAQSWNALTVAASTELTEVPTDPTYAGWNPVADKGDVSPHSRTGVIAGGPQWPIKPDICMEGGNVLADGAGDFRPNHPLLSLRTTDRRDDVSLGSANATSAATAQAARLAALAMATYPVYWPETIRGLLTHHAEWTPVMRAEIEAEPGKKQRRSLLKRYGWGVPDELSLLSSSVNAVTLVVQDEFVPFAGADYRMRNFRLHQLPWPSDVLADLGAADVELRVTLSYFIEPSAARRGWRRRYAYASHGLRFELRAPNETTPEFVRRVNREAALEEEGGTSPASGSDNWTVGPNQRNQGSLHQDIWSGYGAQLAGTGGVLAVHAVGGWWKNNQRKDRIDLPVRYALIVSLRTKAEDVDIYTPIATALSIPTDAIAIEV